MDPRGHKRVAENELRHGVLTSSRAICLVKGRSEVMLCRGMDLRRVSGSATSLLDRDEVSVMVPRMVLSQEDGVSPVTVTSTKREGDGELEAMQRGANISL